MLPRYTQPLSLLVWNNVSVSANTNSPALDTFNCPWVSVFGNVSAATTITVFASADGVNWYSAASLNIGAAGNFYIGLTVGAEFVCLQSSNSVTATAIISAK